MNMALMHILFIAIVISTANAKEGDFPSLDCKAENLGQYGQQSLLECVIKNPKEDTSILMVSWKKGSRTLLLFRNGAIQLQEPGFLFAQASWNASNMNVSLLITNTAVAHQGRYKCDVMTNNSPPPTELIKISLKVTAKYSKPTLTLKTDGTLTCASNGGYPEGQLRWSNERSAKLPNDPQTQATQTNSGLFQLSSKLVVGKESSVSDFTCSVFNASGGREEESQFQVKDEPKTEEQRKELDTATKIVAPVVVIGSLIAGLLLALLIYRRRSQSGHVGVPTSDEVMMEEGDDKYPDNTA
ncbi:CD276 antigen isoform X2 [Clinocottus analis]|uniref:CD276 antigen isoform X2 n=1 Tax=Clinocottus analis TaxID=304258 RepID=UPI0035C1F3CA